MLGFISYKGVSKFKIKLAGLIPCRLIRREAAVQTDDQTSPKNLNMKEYFSQQISGRNSESK